MLSARRRLPGIQELGLVVVILVMGALLTLNGGTSQIAAKDAQGQLIRDAQGQLQRVTVNRFLQRGNIDLVLKSVSWTAIMAVGVTVLIIAGGIDLSIGAIYCLAAVLGGMFMSTYGPAGANWDATLVIALGLGITVLTGVGCGIVNGAMVTILGVHPFIITLGTMQIFRGIAFVVTEGKSVTDYPAELGAGFRYDQFLGWSALTLVPIGLTLLALIAGHVFLRMTAPGRETYAVGGNETAALFSGVRVKRVKVLAFAIAGLSAGVAATIALGLFGSADSSSGQSYELDVIAAAVVGGASLSGGRGSALGAVLGALVIQLISNGILILEIDANYTRIIQGAAIILAVVLDRGSAWLGQRVAVRA